MSVADDPHEDAEGGDASRQERRRHRRGSRSEEAKWRRLRWVTLTLTTLAVVWLLTLGTILVTRSGHTVSTVTGLLSDRQQQRGAAVRRAQDQVSQAGTTAQRQLADARLAAAAADARARVAAGPARRYRARVRELGDDLRDLRARLRRERADRRSLARELPGALLDRIGSIAAPDGASARAALEAARLRLAVLDERLADALAELAAIAGRERRAGRPLDGLDRALRQVERVRADVAEVATRLRHALARLPGRPRSPGG